jgi:translation initiation factor 1
MIPDERPLAWSSDGTPAKPPAKAAPPPATGRVRVRLERQGRGGKAVSVVENLPGHPERIEQLARALKAACGAGGTVKGRTVEIQGDQRERIVAELAKHGIEAVRAGG